MSTKVRGVLITVLAALVLAPVAQAQAAEELHPVTDEEAITDLNTQRAANGIPEVVLNQSLLQPYCSYENHEVAVPGTGGWAQTSSPWEEGPRHKALLYSPQMTSAAYAVYPYLGKTEAEASYGYWQCMWFGWNSEGAESGPLRLYAYTGPQGRASVPLAEAAAEIPFSLQAAVGLEGENLETGPTILVYAFGLGPSPHIVSASLTSASGAVPIRTADGATKFEGEPALFSPYDGAVIPVSPLAGSSTYTATVTWEGAEGVQATQTVSFTTKPYCSFYLCPNSTAPAPHHAAAKAHHLLLRITHMTRERHSLRLTVQASPALYEHQIEITLLDHARSRRHSVILRDQTLIISEAEMKASRVTLSSPAFTRAGVHYEATSTTKIIKP